MNIIKLINRIACRIYFATISQEQVADSISSPGHKILPKKFYYKYDKMVNAMQEFRQYCADLYLFWRYNPPEKE